MRKRWLIASVLALAVVTLLLWWPFPTYDLAKVHPSLRDLPKPYRSVRADSYLDGGSLGVEVVGSDGTVRQYAFPVHAGGNDSQSYPLLFVGGLHVQQKPGKAPLTEITNAAATKAMLLDVLSHGGGTETDLALVQLRGSLADYVRFWRNVFRDRFLSKGR